MNKLIVSVTIAFLLSGCASNSGVVRTGKNSFVITKQAATGFSGIGSLKAEVLKEAYEQCSKTGQSVKVIDSEESKPPYILGNYPRIELTFSCESGG